MNKVLLVLLCVGIFGVTSCVRDDIGDKLIGDPITNRINDIDLDICKILFAYKDAYESNPTVWNCNAYEIALSDIAEGECDLSISDELAALGDCSQNAD